eukprot:GHVT01096979.1.p1 GENE.GHVT01096979.1~~GHVT01096979.1.p1  ORF type:complete len:759 (-),score=50.03 GHVT01096979.1:3904-6180(-)
MAGNASAAVRFRVVVVAYGTLGDVLPLYSCAIRIARSAENGEETATVPNIPPPCGNRTTDESPFLSAPADEHYPIRSFTKAKWPKIDVVFITHRCHVALIRAEFASLNVAANSQPLWTSGEQVPPNSPLNVNPQPVHFSSEIPPSVVKASPFESDIDRVSARRSDTFYDGRGHEVRFVAVDSPPLRASGNAWPNTRAEVQCVEEAIQGDPLANIVLFNFFATAAWHCAQKFQIPSIVVSPCLSPRQMPESFIGRLRDEEQHAAALLDAAEGHEPQPSRLVDWATAVKNRTITWDDIRHWLWRLCVSDHGDIRQEVLGLPPSLFDSQAQGSASCLPMASPVLYLLPERLVHGLMNCERSIQSDKAAASFKVSNRASPNLSARCARLVGFASSALVGMPLSAVTVSGYASASGASECAQLRWRHQCCNIENVAAACCSFRPLVWVCFGSMHHASLQMLPSPSEWTTILSKVAVLTNYSFVLLLPECSPSKELQPFGQEDEFVNMSTAEVETESRVFVVTGLVDHYSLIRILACRAEADESIGRLVCTLTHGSAGSVQLILKTPWLAHVLASRLFDQHRWAEFIGKWSETSRAGTTRKDRSPFDIRVYHDIQLVRLLDEAVQVRKDNRDNQPDLDSLQSSHTVTAVPVHSHEEVASRERGSIAVSRQHQKQLEALARIASRITETLEAQCRPRKDHFSKRAVVNPLNSRDANKRTDGISAVGPDHHFIPTHDSGEFSGCAQVASVVMHFCHEHLRYRTLGR